MTTEKMNIRAALKEKKMLDKRITKLSSEMALIGMYSMDNPFIGLTPSADFETQIKADITSLDSMIRRREAINKAILDANATHKVEVPAFVSFDVIAFDKEIPMEEISLANAINRKAYYDTFLGTVLKNLTNKLQRGVNEWEHFNSQINDKVIKLVRSRFEGVQNPSQDKITAVEEQEREKYKPVLINPADATKYVERITVAVEDYVRTIDNVLSRATETIELTIEY